MATTKKKTPAKAADAGFLTTAAQAIGSTLGQLAKKAGVASSAAPAKPAAKAVTKKKPTAKKKAPAKKKAAVKKTK